MFLFLKLFASVYIENRRDTEEIKTFYPFLFHLFNQTHLVCHTFALEIEKQSFSAPQKESGKRKLENIVIKANGAAGAGNRNRLFSPPL